MGNMTHAAGRMAASKAIDVVFKKVDKDRENGMVKLVDFVQNYMMDEKVDVDFDGVRDILSDENSAFCQYLNKALNELDPHVVKTMLLNLGFEAFLHGTKTIRKMREVHHCPSQFLFFSCQ